MEDIFITEFFELDTEKGGVFVILAPFSPSW